MSLLMMPIMMTFSIIFTRMHHPLSMGLILLLQTVLVCASSGMTSSSFWFSYILFLIFLGGMMVLFIYIASLASNKKFKFPLLPTFLLFLFLLASMMMTFFFFDSMNLPTSNFLSLSSSLLMFYQNKTMLINWIYSPKLIFFTLFIVLYLLLTLLVVVKISYSSLGPMRLSS
uniref:NADH-ubiquinone oxidoreductase chain 6 n=1 Tax=Homologenus malayensis TaxID=1505608 RepID=A0A0A7CCQ6_9EUCA|nr:NADH dehydrogenase subunit 6 [Homologenus malayensis]AIB52337.1 NADH dehydrogenase subunit 6 [Homologenus malayensis]